MTKDIKWSFESIKAGMERYKSLYSKYPSTLDFDKVDFLPTSRMIQRNFGGIVKLKESLNIDGTLDYTKGEYRSSIAKDRYDQAKDYEEDFYTLLISKIPEIRVHEHKILRPGHVCCDFFIYTNTTEGVAIDLFYAQDLFSLARIVNIKFKRYNSLQYPIYFVLVGNENITSTEIDRLITNRKLPLPRNIRVVQEDFFKNNILPVL